MNANYLRLFVLLSIMLVVASGLSGCVTATPVYTSTGAQGFAINCSGMQHTWNDCLAEAGQKCRSRGFTVLERNGSAVPIEYHTYSAYGTTKSEGLFDYQSSNQANAAGFHGMAIHRSMVVMCGRPAASPSDSQK
jgi:hypothetical protein